MASNTARISVFRGRPPAFAGGMWGDTNAHCGSVRSEGYRLRRMLASMPVLSAASYQRRSRLGTLHTASFSGQSPKDVSTANVEEAPCGCCTCLQLICATAYKCFLVEVLSADHVQEEDNEY